MTDTTTLSADAIQPIWKPCRPSVPFTPLVESEMGGTITKAFERQVARVPERLAVRDKSHEWTYDTLNRLANRLAHALMALPGGPDSPVALVLEHGAPAILGILGTVKAGRIYVPIDPRYPAERIRYMLEDSQASAVVVCRGTEKLVADIAPHMPFANVDALDGALSEANPDVAVSPDAPYALYYTSGSTGDPKGVVFDHRCLLSSSRMRVEAYHLSQDDRGSLVSSYATGASVGDIFAMLFVGGSIFPYDLRSNGLAGLLDWVEGQRLTYFHSAPAMFRNLMALSPGRERFRHLRLLSLGGDAIQSQDVQLYKDHMPDNCLLRIGFALTEAAGNVARILVDKSVEPGHAPIPAGYLVKGWDVLILDENGKRLGPDCAGEIVIRGRDLSQGYWRRPDLTQARFKPDPDGSDARIYHTGDLGRLSADGLLTHLGRKDFQVKIRGHRVELAEVEAALLRVPGIRQAVASASPDAQGNQRLVAYVVPGEAPPTVSRIRAALGAVLPEFMVPSSYVYLDAMPLTSNGKVDRKNLPPPDPYRPRLDGECRAPRTATEARLVRIWEEVLGVQPVGVTDNFFDLGGHSLAAARIFAMIEERFGTSLRVTTLLRAPTVEGLAALLEYGVGKRGEVTMVAFQTTGARPPLFCIETRNAGIFVHLARHLGPDRPSYGLHPFGSEHRRLTMESLAAQYLKAIRGIQPTGPYHLCGMCGGGTAAYEVAQQFIAAGERVAWLGLMDAFIPKGGLFARFLRRFTRRIDDRRERHERRAEKKPKTTDPDVARYLGQMSQYIHDTRRDVSRAMFRYRPKPYPGRLVLYHAEETSITEAVGSREAWAEYAKGGAEIVTVPGKHHGILHEPHVAVLAAHIKSCLDNA